MKWDNLENLSEQELLDLRDAIDAVLTTQKAQKIAEAADEAEATGHEYLVALAHAARHSSLGTKPPEGFDGYRLAKLHYKYYNDMGEDKLPEYKAELRLIKPYFYEVDYIFRHTHYDEYSNGWFFRRS